MKKLVCAVVAASPVLAIGQVIEVTTDRSVVDLSIPGGNVVNISVTVDRQGYAEGPWADFEAWTFLEGYLGGTGGQMQIPVEHATDTQSGNWEGRRPPSIAGAGEGANGGFRFTGWGNSYRVGTGTDDWSIQQSGAQQIVGQWDTVLGIGDPENPTSAGKSLNMDQAWPVLGGYNHDRSDRIEIFRARMAFDTPGVHEVSFVPVDCAFWNAPDLTSAVLGLEEVLSVMSVQVATVEARIPAPATLLVLGALPLLRRRR